MIDQNDSRKLYGFCLLNKKKKSKFDLIGEVPAAPGLCQNTGGV